MNKKQPPTQPSWYRARFIFLEEQHAQINKELKSKRISDSTRKRLEQEKKILYWGYVPPPRDKNMSRRIEAIMKQEFPAYYLEMTTGKKPNRPDPPLALHELLRWNTYFLMHPERIAGKEEPTTSMIFPVTVRGDKEDLLRVIDAHIGHDDTPVDELLAEGDKLIELLQLNMLNGLDEEAELIREGELLMKQWQEVA